jgi:L,D-transpeptidase catalytic domain
VVPAAVLYDVRPFVSARGVGDLPRLPLLILVSGILTGLAPAPVGGASPATAAMMPAPRPVQSGDVLARLAPAADPDVLALALVSMRCAQAHGIGMTANRLAVIDYSRPSMLPRLWVFDLALHRLLFEEVVAHGRGSGENIATRFSNDDGSHASSLGLFVTRDTYVGRNGYSLRMQGLEAGVNDNAMARAIVMHGARYVDPSSSATRGRLGRSWGCPAIRQAVARQMIDVMKDGQFVFSYYPDSNWLDRSDLLRCPVASKSS